MKKTKKIKALLISLLQFILIVNLVLPTSAEGLNKSHEFTYQDESHEISVDVEYDSNAKKDAYNYESLNDTVEELQNTEDEKKLDSDDDTLDTDIEDKKESSEEPQNVENFIADFEIPPIKTSTRLLTKVGSVQSAPVADDANDQSIGQYSINIDVSYNQDTEKIDVKAAFFDSDGNVPSDIAQNFYVYFYTTANGTPNRNKIITNNNTISKSFTLSEKEYDIHVELLDANENLLAKSDSRKITGHKPTIKKSDIVVTASSDNEDTGEIEVKGEYKRLAYRVKSETEYKIVEGNRITGLHPGDYYVKSPAFSDGNDYFLSSSAFLITVSGGGVAPVTEYYAYTNGDENVSFKLTKQGIKPGSDISVYIKPVNSNTHYIIQDSITIEPKKNYGQSSFYPSTGELYISNITGDITITAISKEKATVSSITVKNVSFNKNGIYSEENPSIQTTFQVVAKDKDGETVPDTNIYFRDDLNGTSYTNVKKTDENGIATFVYSYKINPENGNTKADYYPLFGTTSSFDKITVSTDIHLVLQLKKDLVLYTHQIIATDKGDDGRVINVPDGYEIWTGTVHQGAITIGSGKWQMAIDGEFNGLSSGQHVIRAGEKISQDGRTIYLASDYDYFDVPKGQWNVDVNTTGSDSVIFTGETHLKAGYGGTVYVFAKPKDGFKIDVLSINKPSYVSGSVHYNEEGGYIVIEGISGSITLTVKAVSSFLPVYDVKNTEEKKDEISSADSNSESEKSNTYETKKDIKITEKNVQSPNNSQVVIKNQNAPNVKKTEETPAVENEEEKSKIKDTSIDDNKERNKIKKDKIEDKEVPLAPTLSGYEDENKDSYIWLLYVIAAVAIASLVAYETHKKRFQE